MTIYQISGLDDSTAQTLKKMDSNKIISELEDLAEEHGSDDSDELSDYDSIPEIKDDDSLTDIEKKQLEIKAQRRSDIRNR